MPISKENKERRDSLKKERQKRFLQEIEKLNLVNPVTELESATGYDNSTVSIYLNPENAASVSFIEKCCEVYSKLNLEFILNGSKDVKGNTDVSLNQKITPRGPKGKAEQQQNDTDERDVLFEKMRQITYNKYKDMIAAGKPQYEMYGDLDLRLYLVEKAIFRRPE